MANTSLLIVACMFLILGFYLKEIAIAIALALIVFAFALKPSKSKSGSPSGSVMVQPIIVKRKYVGPASIYPEKMKIMEFKPDADWKGKALGGVASAIGKTIYTIKKNLED